MKYLDYRLMVTRSKKSPDRRGPMYAVVLDSISDFDTIEVLGRHGFHKKTHCWLLVRYFSLVKELYL